VSEEVPKTGNPCKVINKRRVQNAILAKNVKGFCIGLGESQLPVADDLLRKDNAAVGEKVKVVEQSSTIKGIAGESLAAFILKRAHQLQIFSDTPQFLKNSLHQTPSTALL
jgi:hypothetical protein